MLRTAKRRYKQAWALLPAARFRPAAALRESLRGGYSAGDFRADAAAGVVAGLVALPLAMALAIAVGAPPQHGLYTAIAAGAVIAALGGSRVQVSGPTAAFVAVLVPVVARHGMGGLLVATMMAGVLMMGFGLAGLGKLIEFTPHPVTTGFTTGIAVVIATLQVKDFLGLDVAASPKHYMERLGELAQALPSARWQEAAVGAFTLALLVYWPRITRRVPASLVALGAAAAGAWLLQRFGFEVATIGSRFAYVVDGVAGYGIPPSFPSPAWPWSWPGGNGKPLGISLDIIRDLAPSAFTIAALGSIESLLSAVVADGMTGAKHDPDAELFAQGAGNVVAPFLGGFAATGAIARTAVSARAGARSPVAALVHAGFIAGAVLLFAPLLSHLPMASLAALLLMAAWSMSEVKHFGHMLRVAPGSDVFVLLACFALTVLFDMVVAVTVGIMLAGVLFIRRMAEISHIRLTNGEHPHLKQSLPKGVALYEISGPLFFGAAQKAARALEAVSDTVRVVILDMTGVPAVDATGLVNLESALASMRKNGMLVLVVGVQPQPMKLFRQADIRYEAGRLDFCRSIKEAVDEAERHLKAE